VVAAPVAACIIEDIDGLARGLADFLEAAVPGCRVKQIGGAGAVSPGEWSLVVCGPSFLWAWSGRLGDFEQRPATLAVIADPARVDFASLLAAGVAVLWDYRSGQQSFTSAVQAALAGHPWVSESLAGAMTAGIGEQLRRDLRAADYGLTQREGEILQLLATGSSNRDIAARLFISENTVKNHVRSVLEKLNAGSRTEAVMIGARTGLIDVRAGRG
jgi:DNA-binding CsgD family transcriptional regulator